MRKFLILIAGAILAAGLQSCSPGKPGVYQINTVRFTATQPVVTTNTLAPGIWIDTNVRMRGLGSGTVKSSKPYAIAFDYTDNSNAFEAITFDVVTVTYDDGVVESAEDTLKLPRRVAAREYEAVNSGPGGVIVKTKLNLLSGKLRGAITRDVSFTLRVEGDFTKRGGGTLPFSVDQHFTVATSNGTASAESVLQDT